MSDPITFPDLPLTFQWQVLPVDWHMSDQHTLTITAGAVTDLFVDPQGAPPQLNAPRLLGTVQGDFQLSAYVSVDFQATFDAGVLFIWGDDADWAKLCFEYSPAHQPMVVSVVTRGTSDDANAFAVEDNHIWLRVSRIGTAFAFHASTDGHTWELIRHFALEIGKTTGVGFLTQSPTGAGCTATFERYRFVAQRLGDIRSGE